MTLQFLTRIAASCLALGLLSSCQSSQPSANAPTSANRIEARVEVRQAAPRDLSQDEAAGGHVLTKHVGRTDDELRERLGRERHISAASTYTDRPTAERAVGIAIAESQSRIQQWLNRPGGHSNLVLDYAGDQPVGRTISRGENQSHPCSHAVVVLKYAAPSYYVLTSYPECRS